jgi:hypothetical protein
MRRVSANPSTRARHFDAAEFPTVELPSVICYSIHPASMRNRMVIRRTASAAALAPPAGHVHGEAMFGRAASGEALPRAAAGPLSWSVGRRLAWTGAACLLLWSAVLWALS